MEFLDNLNDRARAKAARVVFPEWDEPRVAAAIAQLAEAGLCQPVEVAKPTDAQLNALISARPMKEAMAARMLEKKPLVRAAAMVAAGEADVLVAGADVPTRRVIEAAAMAIGPADGIGTVSSFFLMLPPGRAPMIFADCAVNVAPDARALADIARSSVTSAGKLLGSARPVLLSYSTGTSGVGESVDLVRAVAEATDIVGPVQADAALNSAIAAKKGLGAGDANVLIFPSLDAGNIGYKLVQELAGAQALGPFLQGFAKPVCDLSRGASVEDIVASTLVTIALT